MRIIIFAILINLSCSNKRNQVIFLLDQLEPQSLTINFEMSNFAELPQDDESNLLLKFDSSGVINTSTPFSHIKTLSSKFCFCLINRCITEDSEFEEMGYEVIVNSSFISNANVKGYTNPKIIVTIKGN